MSRPRIVTPFTFFTRAAVDCALLTAAVAASPYLLLRFLTVKRWRAGFFSRTGIVRPPLEARGGIWLHAVSAGELITAEPLIRKLQSECPGIPLCISVTTEAGHIIASKRFPAIPRFFWPLDLSFSVKRTVNRIQPRLVVLLELEIWPNFLMYTRQAGIRSIVVNGRITERCVRRWLNVKPLARRLFPIIDHFAVQNSEYAGRFRSLGVPPEKISICGNLKFDVPKKEQAPYPVRDRLSCTSDEPIVMAGCTHPGEEETILNALNKLGSPPVVLAPRHIERVTEVLKTARKHHYEPCTVTGGGKGTALVVDTFGMLDSLYQASDVVIMGGTFIPHGGHNFLEPARWKKPIIFGRSIDNFRDIAVGLVVSNAALQVDTERDLEQALSRLLASDALRTELGSRAYNLWREGRGAAQRYISLIKEKL